jgi:predicted glycoside hydrolase/deacetylase ChbG (UPF0249 family)
MTASRQRFLIVNADDFGQSLGINRGVAVAHERGIVTSASLMVRWPAAADAAAYARARQGLSVGLHLDLGEWGRRGDQWYPLYEVVRLDDQDAVSAEVARQLGLFRELLGADPTHLDSHQHVHRWQPIRIVLDWVAGELGIPLRNCTDTIRYCGAFYGQSDDGRPRPDAIHADALIETLANLPVGVTELACHPGQGDPGVSMYGPERAHEVEALCDPRVRAALTDQQITLCSFHTLPDLGDRRESSLLQ